MTTQVTYIIINIMLGFSPILVETLLPSLNYEKREGKNAGKYGAQKVKGAKRKPAFLFRRYSFNYYSFLVFSFFFNFTTFLSYSLYFGLKFTNFLSTYFHTYTKIYNLLKHSRRANEKTRENMTHRKWRQTETFNFNSFLLTIFCK